MITQTIKRWLNRVFAWWPWKRSPASASIHRASKLNQATLPDIFWLPPADGQFRSLVVCLSQLTRAGMSKLPLGQDDQLPMNVLNILYNHYQPPRRIRRFPHAHLHQIHNKNKCLIFRPSRLHLSRGWLFYVIL